MEWFNSLEPDLKIYWGIALVSSFIFVIQTIMTFFGVDSADGMDTDLSADMDHDSPFQIFSFKNLINLFLGYGWTAVCFYNTISSPVWLNIVAILIGLLFVAIFFFLMLQVMKLSKDNTFKLSDTIGKSANVYLFIPGDMKGKGKIQVSVGGAYHEIAAMTEGEKIPTGAKIKVDRLIDNETVLVSKI